jgi:hypothetical protein
VRAVNGAALHLRWGRAAMSDRPTEPDVDELREALENMRAHEHARGKYEWTHPDFSGFDTAAIEQAARCWLSHMEQRETGGCFDCGRPYGDEHGFPDLVIVNDLWRRISPTGDDCGVLCPSCICKRLHDIGVRQAYGSFMSGPVWAVERPVMEALRWAENLREQREREAAEPTKETP